MPPPEENPAANSCVPPGFRDCACAKATPFRPEPRRGLRSACGGARLSHARKIPGNVPPTRSALADTPVGRARITREIAMHCRSLVAVALLAGLSGAARAQDMTKYPAFEGMWDRGSSI